MNMATSIPSRKTEKLKRVELRYDSKAAEKDILAPREVSIESIKNAQGSNRLYFGDNLDILYALLQDDDVYKNVKLIYIDPPFATQGSFLSREQNHAYMDNLAGGEYIEFLRKRLILLREILSEDGSLYLHLDGNKIFEMKIIMDEIFGDANYKNMIVRKKCNPKNYTRKKYGNMVDYILFYTKTDAYIWNKPVEPLSQESIKEYRYTEPETGRKYMQVPLHAPGVRNGTTGQKWRNMLPPPGKHWQYTPGKLEEMEKNGEIHWSQNGNPRRKIYLDQHLGVGIQDVWMDYKDAHNQNIKITGYPTEKNPELLERIIRASSNEGDLVLDCFAGSGTTLAVANELGRKWIGIDNSPEAMKTIISRFENGLKPMGDYMNSHLRPKSQEATLFDDATLDVAGDNEGHADCAEFSLFSLSENVSEIDWHEILDVSKQQV
jgi:adenine-specific DNA-methyltransferase